MIKISDRAEDFLHSKKKDSITIEYSDYRINCCAYSVPLPEIFIKEPEEKFKSNYKCVVIDGFKIYIGRNVIWPSNNMVKIDLENILGYKRLTLDGWDLSEILES